MPANKQTIRGSRLPWLNILNPIVLLCCSFLVPIDYLRCYGYVIESRNIEDHPVVANLDVTSSADVLVNKNPLHPVAIQVADVQSGISSGNDAISPAIVLKLLPSAIATNDDDSTVILDRRQQPVWFVIDGNGKNSAKRSSSEDRITTKSPSVSEDYLPNDNHLKNMFEPQKIDCLKGTSTLCEIAKDYPTDHVKSILNEDKRPFYFWTDVLDIQRKNINDIRYDEPKQISIDADKFNTIQDPTSVVKDNLT